MDLQLWKKNRRRTLFTFLLSGVVYGIDYSLVLVTIIPYLEKLVKTDKSLFYYGLCISIYNLVAVLADLVIGRIADRSRNIKLAVCVCLLFGILGNVIYAVYFSPILLIVGRAIVGIHESIWSLLIGEIMRTYEETHATRVQCLFIAACSLGYASGPWISVTFSSINVVIGDIMVINQHNFVGVFLALVFLFNMFIVYMFAHDCSKEYDMKSALHDHNNRNAVTNDIRNTNGADTERGEYDELTTVGKLLETTSVGIDVDVKCDKCQESNGNNTINLHREEKTDESEQQLIENNANNPRTAINTTTADQVVEESIAFRIPNPQKTPKDNTSSLLNRNDEDSYIPKIYIIFKGFATHFEIFLLMTSTFILGYISATQELYIPIIVFQLFKWNELSLNIIYSVDASVYFFVILSLSKICTTNKRVYTVTMLGITSTIMCLTLMICMTSITLRHSSKIILIIVYMISSVPVWCLEEVTHSNMLAKMVPSGIQNFTEAVRSGLSRISHILASLIIALEFDLIYWAISMIAITVVFLALFVIINKRLRNIKIIDFYR